MFRKVKEIIKTLWGDKESVSIEPNYLSYEDYEFLDINLNGKIYPPGSVAEIFLPSPEYPYYSFRMIANDKDTLMWATGNVRIVAILKRDMPEEKKGGPNV